MYVGKSSKNPKGNKFLIILIIVLLVWVLVASIVERSPIGLFSGAWKYMVGDKENQELSYSGLKEENLEKDSLIAELEQALDMIKKSNNYQQAVVNVDSDNLNMRIKPALGADVVLQLPVGSVVEVLYFDAETYRIGGEYGKWVKIRFANKEGWVWGNYIKLIE